MEIVGYEVCEARSLLASADGWFTKEETFKQIKEIMSKKPLTLSDKCKKCREEHLELKNNRICNYVYCNKEDWDREQYNYNDKE